MKQSVQATAKKQQIVEAAVRVLSREGASAFTHRAVAQEADVPLGLTTYYFKSRDDLLKDAIETTRQRGQHFADNLLTTMIDEHGMVCGLSQAVAVWTDPKRDDLTMNYRVYVSALYQPNLKSVVASWHPEKVLRNYTDEQTARTISLQLEGILIHSVINGRSFTAEDVEEGFARLWNFRT